MFLWNSQGFPGAAVLLGWYGFGLAAAAFLFGYSNYYLSKIVSEERNRLLADLQSRLDGLYADMNGLDPARLGLMKQTLDLYERIRKSPGSSLRFPVIRA